MNVFGLCVFGGTFLLISFVNGITDNRDVQYEHFTDYLLKLGDDLFGEEQQSTIPRGPSTGQSESRISTADSQSTRDRELNRVAEELPEPVSTLDILGYFRDVPRRHWSCCMLGKLAGDKGFHCMAQFYAASIQFRNHNRAQNRRMPVRVPDYGKEIKHHFGRCVRHRSTEFHKCCYAASIERAEISQWKRRQRERAVMSPSK